MAKRKGIIPYSEEDVATFCKSKGFPTFHAKQVREWLFKKHAISFSEMTNLSKELREALDKAFYIHSLTLLEKKGDEGETEKFLFELYDKEQIEAVVLYKQGRVTFCLSTQVGCPLRCAFCATGRMGYTRDLTAEEILAQFLFLRSHTKKVNSIVFMGMGEPLLNLKSLTTALDTITGYKGFNLGARHITISTAGDVKGIRKLSQLKKDVRLAVSLHSLRQEVRASLMPIAKRVPLTELIPAIKQYAAKTKRMVTFEWVMLKDVTDKVNEAYRLVELRRELPFKVNIIPYNPVTGSAFAASGRDEIRRFRKILEDGNIEVVERYRQGRDINAACGQLAVSRQEHAAR